MWIFTPIGFFSAVRDAQNEGCVLVRARAKADAWNLYRRFSTAYPAKRRARRFKMTRPKADEHRDYRWRISLKKKDWAKIVYRLSMSIEYTNFKDEVHRRTDQTNKNSAYMTIWSAMNRVQRMEDSQYRPQTQRTFSDQYLNWNHHLDAAIAESRFDAEPAIATKTIRSVITGKAV